MRQIPELLFMTYFRDCRQKWNYTLDHKLYISSLCLDRMDAIQINTLRTHLKKWQKWLNGYEAQNEGTGPYLSHTYTPLSIMVKCR